MHACWLQFYLGSTRFYFFIFLFVDNDILGLGDHKSKFDDYAEKKLWISFLYIKKTGTNVSSIKTFQRGGIEEGWGWCAVRVWLVYVQGGEDWFKSRNYDFFLISYCSFKTRTKSHVRWFNQEIKSFCCWI